MNTNTPEYKNTKTLESKRTQGTKTKQNKYNIQNTKGMLSYSIQSRAFVNVSNNLDVHFFLIQYT